MNTVSSFVKKLFAVMIDPLSPFPERLDCYLRMHRSFHRFRDHGRTLLVFDICQPEFCKPFFCSDKVAEQHAVIIFTVP